MTSHDTDRDTPPGRETPPGNVHRLQPRRAPPGAMFFAERDPAVQWRSTAVLLMLMAPLAFFAPASFITGTLAALAVGWWNERGFRFAVDRRELIVKIATLAPTLKVPLAEIAEARLLPDTASLLMPMQPRSGHLLLRKTDGTQLLVPGLKDAAEVVEAIRLLKQDGSDDAELDEPLQPPRAAA